MSVPADMLPGMKIELTAIDPDVIEDIIGTDSYDAALGYVRRRAVGRQTWAGAHHALFGIVLGSHGDYFTPAIFFSPGPPLEVLRVHCGCAARHGCEHAAALLISALEGGVEAAAALPAIPRQTRRSPAWDASLEAWLPAGPQARRQPETTLAIELTLMSEHGLPVTAPASPRLRLIARLVQPGKHKDVIISGGENISSVEVEGVLLRHPAVQEVAIVGLPHEKWGETSHAFVMLRDGGSATEEEIIAFARERLAHFKAPRGVTFVAELPKTATGKIQKFVLRKGAPNLSRQ